VSVPAVFQQGIHDPVDGEAATNFGLDPSTNGV
jgi:hypothetical protein